MAETEKITINLSVVDLGKIDLLVEEGFYSNRTDFIRSAVRQQLYWHDSALQESVVRRALVLGVLHYSRQELEALRDKGEHVAAHVVGLLIIDDDVPAQLAQQVFDSVKVFGSIQGTKAVKKALGRV